MNNYTELEQNTEVMALLDQVYRFVLDQQNLKKDSEGIPYAFIARNFGKRALRLLPKDMRLISIIDLDRDRFVTWTTKRGGYKVSATPVDKLEQVREMRRLFAEPLDMEQAQPE